MHTCMHAHAHAHTQLQLRNKTEFTPELNSLLASKIFTKNYCHRTLLEGSQKLPVATETCRKLIGLYRTLHIGQK